jgi:cytochrome c
MRDQIFVVTMNEQGEYEDMERFLPGTTFSNPIDMLFGPDGALYVLEYGNTWNAANPDARLSRIDFVAGD